VIGYAACAKGRFREKLPLREQLRTKSLRPHCALNTVAEGR